MPASACMSLVMAAAHMSVVCAIALCANEIGDVLALFLGQLYVGFPPVIDD
jgi:hypothetical protein